MLDVWTHARQLGLNPIPSWAADWPGRFEWDLPRVKDFFGRYIAVGVRLREEGRWTDALWVFDHVLEAGRPTDHLPLYHALDCALAAGRPGAAARLAEQHARYPDGYVDFARLIAKWHLFVPELLREDVERAVDAHPAFGKLVAQKRKRDRYELGSGLSGEDDFAKEYWNEQGRYWEAEPEAVVLVREAHIRRRQRSYRRESHTNEERV